jgi:hypothetical protein
MIANAANDYTHAAELKNAGKRQQRLQKQQQQRKQLQKQLQPQEQLQKQLQLQEQLQKQLQPQRQLQKQLQQQLHLIPCPEKLLRPCMGCRLSCLKLRRRSTDYLTEGLHSRRVQNGLAGS